MYTRGIMPDLRHRLQPHDLGFLQIVAEIWGIDLGAPDARTALSRLAPQLLDPALIVEIVEALPEGARRALDALIRHDGWMAWGVFSRQFGTLREVGPGRRDREKPYLDPASPVEALWYRALIGRDFLRRDGELQECAYIPDDLLILMPPVVPEGPQPPGRAASRGETKHIIRVTDRILDHACTLLAALRLEDPHRSPAEAEWQPPFDVLHALLAAVKLISSSEQPVAEDARPFLEMPRSEALAWLVQGWQESVLFNELKLMPGILCEGAWANDPRQARQALIAHLSHVPEKVWWHLGSFIGAVFERQPDFQRPAGDYDTWLIRDANTGQSLTGVQHWGSVDGALLRYLITGPMHWLGLIDLAAPAPGEDVTAFRFSDWAEDLLMGKPPAQLLVEDQPIEVRSDGILAAGPLTPRLARYQVSRFCLWSGETADTYMYQLTPASLNLAGSQGLKVVHLEKLLKQYAKAVPPSLLRALHQWRDQGGQIWIRPAVVLQVATPQILQALRDSPAARFLDEALGPTSALIQPGAAERVAAVLARLGYLSDVKGEDDDQHQPDQEKL